MYCRFCGKQTPDNSIFCPHCGQKQETQTLSPQSSSLEKHILKEEPAVDPSRALVGLQGWLGFFGLCIFIAILISSYNLFTELSFLSVALTTDYAHFYILNVIGIFLVLITQCAFLYTFLKERRIAVVLAIAMLLISAALAFFDYALVRTLMTQLRQPIPDNNILGLQKGLSAAVLWIPYFLRSKRVKQTLIK